MRLRGSRVIATFAALLGLAGAALVLASSASAVSGTWDRQASGTHSWGHPWKANGYIKDAYNVKDNKADGSCAYIESAAVTYNEFPPGSAWVTGGTHRHEICGNGNIKRGTDTWSISGSSSPFTTKIKLTMRTCRDIAYHPDNCSDWYITPSWSV